MGNNTIYVSGFFSEDELAEIDLIRKDYHDSSFDIKVTNLSGEALQSIFEYCDLELIAIPYTLLLGIISNGMYDSIKQCFLRLWSQIKHKGNMKQEMPLTIKIEGIPTINGPETIRCKIPGNLSIEARESAIEKTFALAKQIEKHQFELQKLRLTTLEGHFIRYDDSKEVFYEIDPLEEVHQKMSIREEEKHQ